MVDELTIRQRNFIRLPYIYRYSLTWAAKMQTQFEELLSKKSRLGGDPDKATTSF